MFVAGARRLAHWLNRDLPNDIVFDLENAIAFLKSKLRFYASRLLRESGDE